tara:strand:+ start:22065 stop:22601 length:537 start_codon:yes stop_codon:yes gene_type:complete
MFISDAMEMGIDSLTAVNVLSLIEKRKTDLQSLNNQKEGGDDISELFESTDLKTKSEIKQEFSRNLAKIISKREFSELFGYVFMKNVRKKTVSKIGDLKKIENLTEDQEKEIKTMMEIFYFNKETFTAYFAFDKKLQKQKLSALRFRFEEKYAELRTQLNLEVKSNVKVNNRTYLWNN